MKKGAQWILGGVLAALVLMTARPCGAVPAGPVDELDALIEPSDLIVQGHVETLNQGLRETEVVLQIERVFKGDPNLQTVKIRHQGGKHVVVETEPEFMSYDRAILFLQKRGEAYVCTSGTLGKKTIRNDNVYMSEDNSFLTLRLNKYQDAIAARLKALEAQKGGIQGLPQSS